MNTQRIIVSFALGLALAMAGTVSAEQVVIANPSVGTDNIDADTLKKVFLGKATKLGNGNSVNFVVLAGGDTHEAFLKSYVSKTPSQFLSYWRKLAFSGQGQLPSEMVSDEAMIAHVKATPGAIGYVSAAPADGGVTVLTVQ